MAVEVDKLVYGGDMILFLQSGSTSGTTYNKPIAFSTSAKITVNMKTREATSKDSGNWTDKLPGKLDWSCSSDALFSDGDLSGTTAFKILYDHMVNRSGVTMNFAIKSGTAAQWTVDTSKDYFQGTIYLTSLDVNAPDGEQVTYSMSAEGTGVLIYT